MVNSIAFYSKEEESYLTRIWAYFLDTNMHVLGSVLARTRSIWLTAEISLVSRVRDGIKSNTCTRIRDKLDISVGFRILFTRVKICFDEYVQRLDSKIVRVALESWKREFYRLFSSVSMVVPHSDLVYTHSTKFVFQT